MKFRLFGLIALCCALLTTLSLSDLRKGYSQAKKPTPTLSQSEQDLLNEINQARTNPQAYATYLEKLKPLFHGKEYRAVGQNALITQEGWSAVEDAIKFMRAAKPLAPLSASQGLCFAAMTHVNDQSGTGATGHAGVGMTMVEQRVKPFGNWQGGIGENLTYGNESARERLLTWLIDDGVASRGHRNRLMSDSYKVAGISCGPHPEYGTMCVVTLAGGFTDSANAQAPAKGGNSGQTLKNRPPDASLSVGTQPTKNANSAQQTSTSGTSNANKSKSKPR